MYRGERKSEGREMEEREKVVIGEQGEKEEKGCVERRMSKKKVERKG